MKRYVVNEPVVNFSNGERAFVIPSSSFENEEIYFLQGSNGSGKTTLLNHLSEHLLPKNEVLILDQNYSSLVFGYHSVWWNIALSQIIGGSTKSEAKQLAINIMKDLKVDVDPDRKAWNLSGGEKRIITLCRFFLSKTKLLLLDEPVANLDRARQNQIWNMIREMPKKGITVILVSHDLPPIVSEKKMLDFEGVGGRSLRLSTIQLGNNDE